MDVGLGTLSLIFGDLPYLVLAACGVLALIAAGVVWAVVRLVVRRKE